MTVAEVKLWGTRIGTVGMDDDSHLGSFEYDRDFLLSGIQVSPVMMPLSRRVYSFPDLSEQSFHGLPGLLADSLPDKFGNAVIDAWLAAQGRSPESFNSVERLCYTGNRGMGALEFYPAMGPSAMKSERIAVDHLVDLAAEVLRTRESLHVSRGEDAMQQILQVGTSAGGARAKAIIAWNEKTGEIRSGQIPAGTGYGYWLMKFDGVSGNGDKEGEDGPQYTRIEYAYSRMARAAGIRMTECRLYEENGRRHFMMKRFDRNPETGDKIHMQTLGGLAHFDYNVPGVHSYEGAAGIMRQIGISNTDISQMYRRMVFNVLARNQDDHVKNISFLMDRSGRWSLSPAYDVTYAYNPTGFWTGKHQMTVQGKREGITLADLRAAARAMGVKRAEAEHILEAVRGSLTDWPSYAEEANLREDLMEKIQHAFIEL